MDNNKPTLSQYFSDTEKPPSSQFFDEIVSSPLTANLQNHNLEEKEGAKSSGASVETPSSSYFTAQSSQSQAPDAPTILPTVSGSILTVSGSIPTASGSIPAASRSIPAASGSIPAASGSIPAASGSIPTASGSIPTARNIPDPGTFFKDAINHQQLPHEMTVMEYIRPSLLTLTMNEWAKSDNLDVNAHRRRCAWIPNEEAKQILERIKLAPKGTYFPDREVLTMPGVVLDEDLPDNLQETAVKYLGVGSAGARTVVRADHVSQDEAGLRQLIRTGYFRAALNLTNVLLTAAGQGPGRMGRPSKHTPRTLQVWLTRFTLMVKLRLFEPLLKEAEPFGDLSKPDMFYEFYPDQYENLTGSMAPFALRLLLAELPGHAGNHSEAIYRLQRIMVVLHEMVKNVDANISEDGTREITGEEQKQFCREWIWREKRTQDAMVNCAISLKMYPVASYWLKRNLDIETDPVKRRDFAATMMRVWLMAGNGPAAQRYLQIAKDLRMAFSPIPDFREYVDMALLDIHNDKYQEAYENFGKAAELDPTDMVVANNMAVCLLFLGRLKDAIAMFKNAFKKYPNKALSEAFLINLSTLYELESSTTTGKKLELLRLLCQYKSDTLPNVAECLKLS